MADTRPSRRQAAMQGQKRIRVMLDSDRSSSSEDESHDSRNPTDRQPSPESEEEPEEGRDYWIETWWFDNGRQGFTRGRTAKYSTEQVRSAHVLRAAAQHMWSQPRMFVRFVTTSYRDGVPCYEIAGRVNPPTADEPPTEDDAVAEHIATVREDPTAERDQKLRIIFHEPGDSDAVQNVLWQLGFPMYMEPT